MFSRMVLCLHVLFVLVFRMTVCVVLCFDFYNTECITVVCAVKEISSSEMKFSCDIFFITEKFIVFVPDHKMCFYSVVFGYCEGQKVMCY